MKATLCVFVALVAVTTANPGTNLPMCTPSTAANPGVAVPAACSCGSDGVAVPAGRFCGLKADGRGTMLDVPTCPTAKTDGKSSPSAHCNCGTEFYVFISPSEFCLVTTGVTGTKRYTPLGITSPTAGPTRSQPVPLIYYTCDRWCPTPSRCNFVGMQSNSPPPPSLPGYGPPPSGYGGASGASPPSGYGGASGAS